MSKVDTKNITLDVKDLINFGKEQHVADLTRFLSEMLPQIEITKNGNELEVTMPKKLSKRAIRLRIRKFLHQNGLYNEFRPISITTSDKNGYMIKQKKSIEITYY
ncbi:MAG: hypothetical protein EU531_02510 [Promethearchaeota archaeon]|nr:MAG: hypothetical protein EU531_02510 [Candidatus Lokiarchaeota archaeon]